MPHVLPLASLALFSLAVPQDKVQPTQDEATLATPEVPEFEVIVLEHSGAEEMAAVLDATFEGGKFMSDPRTNSLLVMASDEAMPQVKELVVRLDVKLESSPQDGLFPASTGDLVVPAGDGNQWSMMALVEEYGRLTDQHFVITPETRNFLESTQTALTRSVVVPKAEVQSFFESMLVQMDFVLLVHRSADPRLLSIESLNTGSRTTIRQNAIIIPHEELARYASHPSLLVTTVVNLPNMDVRQLSNSMRTMITDANTQQMLPAGNSNSMVLTGFAPQIADLARLLLITDAVSKVEVPQPTFARYQLEKAVASEIASMIEELVEASNGSAAGAQSQSPQGVVQGSRDPGVRVMADARTNSLIVMALPQDMEKVEQLVGLLDQ